MPTKSKPSKRATSETQEVIPYDKETDLYDPNDDVAVDAFWNKANITRGRGRPSLAIKRPTLNMRVDPDVLEALKATGPGWQTRINNLLKEAVKKGMLAS
jgi:uncharacterized protein (DUF4415 family)